MEVKQASRVLGEKCVQTHQGEKWKHHTIGMGVVQGVRLAFSPFTTYCSLQPFFAAWCLAFWIVGPPGLQKTTEVLQHHECAGIVGPRQTHRGCGITWGAAGKLGVDFKFIHGTVTGEERARRERDLKP